MFLLRLMVSENGSLDSKLQQLRAFRGSLLHLHKALLDSERQTYEQTYGRINSSNEFLRLVLGHQWFDWLRPFSQFIALIDETLASEDPATLEQINALLSEARVILRSDDDGTPAEQKYHEAIQRDSEIAYWHVEAITRLRDRV